MTPLVKQKRLLEFLAANELEQIIKEPTRVTLTQDLLLIYSLRLPQVYSESLFRS